MTTGEQRLEALLRSAASDDAAWPATPDLRAGVMARIEATQPAGASAGPAPAGRPMAGEAARSRTGEDGIPRYSAERGQASATNRTVTAARVAATAGAPSVPTFRKG